MDMIAFFCSDEHLFRSLESIRGGGFYLHGIPSDKSTSSALNALEPLGVLGAIILDPARQQEATASLAKQSIMVEAIGAVDTVVVTPAGLVGDYTLGYALSSILNASQWNVRGARGVVVGSDSVAKAIARELSSLGMSHLTLIAENNPLAEALSPDLAASTEVVATTLDSGVSTPLIEQADLLVKASQTISVPEGLLGPHLNIIELSQDIKSGLREAATRVGAKSIGLRDVQAYQLSHMLEQILGKKMLVEPFLNVLNGHTL